jgi:hypothetical protein
MTISMSRKSFCAQKLLRDISAFYHLFRFVQTLIFYLTFHAKVLALNPVDTLQQNNFYVGWV